MPRDRASSVLHPRLTYLLSALTGLPFILSHALGLALTVGFPLTPARIHLNQPRHVVWLSWVDIRCLTCLLETNLSSASRKAPTSLLVSNGCSLHPFSIKVPQALDNFSLHHLALSTLCCSFYTASRHSPWLQISYWWSLLCVLYSGLSTPYSSGHFQGRLRALCIIEHSHSFECFRSLGSYARAAVNHLERITSFVHTSSEFVCICHRKVGAL